MTQQTRTRRLVALVLFSMAILASHPASAFRFGINGTTGEDLDTTPSSRLRISTPFSGAIETLTLDIDTSPDFSDELRLTLHHGGRSATFYVGQDRTETALINATFSDDFPTEYPTSGTASGFFVPAPDLLLGTFRGQDMQGIWELEIDDPSGNMDGTDVTNWSLTIGTSAGGPRRNVALFFDGTYVDIVDDPNEPGANAEALNLETLLGVGAGDPGEEIGGLRHNVTTFTGTSASAFQNALAGQDVLVIPSLEGPNEGGADLFSALSGAARDEIRNFVQNGGILITNPTLFGFNRDLVNGLFGYSTTVAQSLGGSLQPASLGTPFQGAPGVITPASLIFFSLQNLPPQARVMWEGPGSALASTNPVVVFDEGSGKVVWLAYTYHNAFPEGTGGAGWDVLLDRAVKDDLSTTFQAQQVALFNDGNYVDNAAGQEAANTQEVLESFGHNVTPFSGIDQSAFQNALVDAQALIIPELEVADLEPALSTGARDEIVNFVDGGGVLVLHSAANINLLNSLFGFMNFAGTSAEAFKTTSSLGTAFADVVGVLDEVTPLDALAIDDQMDPESGMGIPDENAFAIHAAPNDAMSAAFLVGAGRVVWLGWDFSDAMTAANPGGQNGGWFDTLDRAVTVVPEPASGSAALACLVALGAIAARRRRGRP